MEKASQIRAIMLIFLEVQDTSSDVVMEPSKEVDHEVQASLLKT